MKKRKPVHVNSAPVFDLPFIDEVQNVSGYDDAFEALQRLSRTFQLLIIAGYVQESKVKQAYELAS